MKSRSTKTEKLMTKDVATCGPHDSLNRAAQLMWERDIGCVPVTSDSGELVGVLTDRDICMASYTKGGSLCDHSVGSAMSTKPISVSSKSSIADAEERMRSAQIRRIPVVDAGKVSGMLSLNDIARANDTGGGANEVATTLARISKPRGNRQARLTVSA